MAEPDDAGGVETDDDLEIPPLEVRVPPEWQSRLSARSLAQAEPMAAGKLVVFCASALEHKAARHGGEQTHTLPLVVWDDLLALHGSLGAAEAALASLVSGVERCWTTHAAVEAFGELCGLLNAEYSELVCSRVLSLFRPSEEGQPLLPADDLGAAVMAEWGGALELQQVEAALPRLALSDAELGALSAAVRQLAADGPEDGLNMKVRVDQLLLAVHATVRANAAAGEREVLEAVVPDSPEAPRADAPPPQAAHGEASSPKAAHGEASSPKAAHGDASSPEAAHGDAAEAAAAGGAAKEAEPPQPAADQEAADEYEDDAEADDAAVAAAEYERDAAAADDDDDEDDAEADASAAAAAAAAALWPSLSARLAECEGEEGEAARRRLFAACAAEGVLPLSCAPQLLLALHAEAAAPLLTPPLRRAFAAAGGDAADALPPAAFERLLRYLRATVEWYGALAVEAPTAGVFLASGAAEAAVDALAARGEAWRAALAEWRAAWASLGAAGEAGGVPLDEWVDWAARQYAWRAEEEEEIDLSALNIPNTPLAPPDILRDDSADGEPHTFPPEEGLEPVFESTEKSAFSASPQWTEAKASHGSKGAGVAAGGDDLDSLTHHELLAECRRARAELAASREAEARATKNVRRVMEANKALQKQLKDLNTAVESIVNAELGTSSRSKGRAVPPPSVFPDKAKPTPPKKQVAS